jgi:hypothetical protein
VNTPLLVGRAKRDAQHADVKLLTILERVDPKPSGVEQLGLFLQSPDQYARRSVPLLFTPELDGRNGILSNRKDRPTSPSKGFDAAYVARFMTATKRTAHPRLGRSGSATRGCT